MLSCSRQWSREILPRIWSNESCLVPVVSVLNVLGKPVLGPIDLLTTHRNMEVIQDDPELVVLHLVVNTVVPGHRAVPLLLILEVVPHSLLEFGQVVCILRVLRHSKDLGKQNIMLLIKSVVLKSYNIEIKLCSLNNLFFLTSVAKL